MSAAGHRIAVISHGHPSVSKGGAEISAYNLFRGLKEIDADPVFIAACPASRRAGLALAGPDEHAVVYEDDGSYSYFYHVGNPELVDRFARILSEQHIAIANFHHFLHFGLASIEAASKLGVRSYMSFHEYLAICHHHGQMVTRPDFSLCTRASPGKCHRCYPEAHPRQFTVRREWLLNAFNTMSGYVSPSHFLKGRLTDWGLPEEKISVIENGLVPPRIDGASRGEREPSKPWVFGYFGQINPFKGVDLLLETAEMLHRDPAAAHIRIRVHGNIVGASDVFLERMRRCSELPNFSYSGSYDNEDALSLMQACDYVVVPSRWWENSPVVIQEAYRAECPVIASALGGLAEKVVDGRTGFTFPVGSPSDLARTMIRSADLETYTRLRAGLTKPIDHVDMARAYVNFMDVEDPA